MSDPGKLSKLLFYALFAASFFVLPKLITATGESKDDPIRSDFYRFISPDLPLEKDRVAVCSCAISQLRSAGVLTGDRKDQVFQDVKSACYRELTGLTLAWNTHLRDLLREQIFAHERFIALDSLQKMQYLDCFIANMKMRYPIGMNRRIPEQTLSAVCSSCIPPVPAERQVSLAGR